MPLYSTNYSLYHQPSSIQHYQMLDTKPVYHSTWSVPYPDESSPVENYSLDQSATFLPQPETMTASQMCESVCAWNVHTMKNLNDDASVCFDPEPCCPTHELLPSVQSLHIETPETSSPLNMSSLQITLPERPHGRKLNLPGAVPEAGTTQRQLPVPQPSHAQSSRNVVDELQDRRLRSIPGASIRYTQDPFLTPKVPLRAYREYQTSASELTRGESQANVVAPIPISGNAISYLTAAASIANEAKLADTASQPDFKFNTSSLLDPVTPPTLVNPYSNFRESSHQASFATQLTRHSSHPDLYSLNNETLVKRDSMYSESFNEGRLSDGHSYTPIKHSSPPQISTADRLRRGSFELQSSPSTRILIPGPRSQL